MDEGAALEAIETALEHNKQVCLDAKTVIDPGVKNQYDPKVFEDHAYVVEEIITDPLGTKKIKLRNPWGFDHPIVQSIHLSDIFGSLVVLTTK